jgi:glutathionylspermidine synthase
MSDALACAEPLEITQLDALLRDAVFSCNRWNQQEFDHCTVSPAPIVIRAEHWAELARDAEALAQEALLAEREILRRSELFGHLGLPRQLAEVLPSVERDRDGLRAMRVDFHPLDTGGYAISEVNTDVAAGWIEASGLTALFADRYPGLRTAGDPVTALVTALAASTGSTARVGLMHMTTFTEDRQIALYLARRLRAVGLRATLFDAAQLRLEELPKESRHDDDASTIPPLRAATPEGVVELDALFRFFPGHWLPRLPQHTGWRSLARAGACTTNPVSALLTQSKLWPLTWPHLTTVLKTFRRLLPETRSPSEVPHQDAETWVIKPAFGHEGHRVTIPGVASSFQCATALKRASRYPRHWAAQRLFRARPLPTSEGLRYPAIGVFVVDGHACGAYGRLARVPLVDDRAQEAVILLSS